MDDSDDALSMDTSDEPPTPLDPDEDPEGIEVHPLPEVGGREKPGGIKVYYCLECGIKDMCELHTKVR